ncbi:helix-turn-helix domain-containing protein [Paenibacillus sp. 1011MAR3C5]|uniref:bifunctional transcriptional activator/DNA repair enzyme AdaA n=1 Tax=Paenibacillus sp. 1011MAR3C5 TaxID=1675787 RepID=UPI000E6C7873|nr:bifunctional transcriptional activator/DNA repair enzyme AdaA [Paenibacillus sp. 1011MAR3C5]RJE82608.1 helix-turn-helix domain-containing protein [Paenibacillus sp. 1011MAR3C5]
MANEPNRQSANRATDVPQNRKPGSISEEQWTAICANDGSYDGRFYYAVRTTGIYCRPSCKSRPPKRSNAEVFPTSADAVSAGYRPCKRCKPAGERLPDEEWSAQIAAYVDRHYMEELDLATLGEICHGSPYHLHRTFKKIMGMTPLAYVQQIRMRHAARLLAETDSPVSRVGELVGIRNTPYFITLFKKTNGSTPAAFRQRLHIGGNG